ncbi:MAG: sigma-70 family RNA polymerase sigma factor [Candidatus Hydrogenedentales bacterium]
MESDGVLARRWQLGSRDAAATIAERYADALGAVAFGVVGDVALAKEVVQEAFVRATRQIRTLNEPDKLGAWLVAIARHAALDTLRRRTLRRETPLDGIDPPGNGNPALDAERGELADRLQTVVAALPEDQRDIFAMKYVAGMPYAAIAHALGISADAVGQKLWRIRQKLQRELQEFKP